MADELVNMSQLVENLSPVILDKFSPLITIFKAVGIVLLIYIIFLITKALFRWRAVSKINKIAKNVDQINKKLGILIEKIDKLGKISKEEKIKKKKGKK